MKKLITHSHYRILSSVLIALTVLIGEMHSHAAAKKPVDPGSSFTTPQPLRKVILQPVGAKGFQLPNGVPVDFSSDLQTMVNTAVTSYSGFAPTDPNETNSCNTHLEIRSAVTNFQLNVSNFDINFGYSPSGSIPVSPNPNINAQVNVQIGTISMDFSIWRCAGSNCSSIGAATSTHLTSGVNLNLTVDFGTIKTGSSFIYNTPLAGILNAIIKNGIQQLATSTRVNDLPWQSQVRQVNSASGMVIFDSGKLDRIGKNQTFEIYAPTDATPIGICNVFEVVAYIHTLVADTVSSTAIIDQTFGSRGVQVGDVVMIRDPNLK